jgi:transaldolase
LRRGAQLPLSDMASKVERAHQEGSGPAIWLAGDPDDLPEWMERGAAGIVTNTVVLNEMVQKYGHIDDVIKRYLDITDLPVVVEVDGHTTEEILEVSHHFTAMSSHVIIKIPCGVPALGAFRALKAEGVDTFCTTAFSLTQAAAVAQAGATHVLPFCEPVKQHGGDPTQMVRECASMFSGWQGRPFITAALIRSAEVAHAALRDGADGIIIFWTVLRDMMEHPLTKTWNGTFLEEWQAMHAAGHLEGVPVRPETLAH